VVVERLAPEAGEAGLDRQYVVAQTRAGVVELGAVPTLDVGAHLRPEPEPEPASGGLLDLPGQ